MRKWVSFQPFGNADTNEVIFVNSAVDEATMADWLEASRVIVLYADRSLLGDDRDGSIKKHLVIIINENPNLVPLCPTAKHL